MCDVFRLSRKKVILRKKGLNLTKTEVVYGIIIMGAKEKVNERIFLKIRREATAFSNFRCYTTGVGLPRQFFSDMKKWEGPCSVSRAFFVSAER